MAKYKTGYKRPPKEHRFKPGTNGNPAGRPRRKPASCDEGEIIRRLDAELVQFNGQTTPRRRVELMQLKRLAVGGNQAALRLLEKPREQARQAACGGGVVHMPSSYWDVEKKEEDDEEE